MQARTEVKDVRSKTHEVADLLVLVATQTTMLAGKQAISSEEAAKVVCDHILASQYYLMPHKSPCRLVSGGAY